MTEAKPDDKPDDKPDENAAVDKLKKLFNEVLDERETKAAAAKEEKPGENPEGKRTTPKRSFMQELFGG